MKDLKDFLIEKKTAPSEPKKFKSTSDCAAFMDPFLNRFPSTVTLDLDYDNRTRYIYTDTDDEPIVFISVDPKLLAHAKELHVFTLGQSKLYGGADENISDFFIYIQKHFDVDEITLTVPDVDAYNTIYKRLGFEIDSEDKNHGDGVDIIKRM